MDHRARPFRSVLYIPASKERALDKARSLPADAIIFDLEDSVAVEEKATARGKLAQQLAAGGFGGRTTLVRINALDTPWGEGDLAAFAGVGPDAILLPKVGARADVELLASRMDGLRGYGATAIWAMIESPDGVLNAAEIARGPRMAGFVMGTNDLAKDLGLRPMPDRAQLQAALQLCLLAARAAGIVAVDGVFNAFRDEAGLAAECTQGRNLGFDGKSLIHPAQLAPANAAFSPSPEELDLAERQIAAFEAAEAAGQGVAVVDGSIVEALHVETAHRLIARSGAIAALEAGP